MDKVILKVIFILLFFSTNLLSQDMNKKINPYKNNREKFEHPHHTKQVFLKHILHKKFPKLAQRIDKIKEEEPIVFDSFLQILKNKSIFQILKNKKNNKENVKIIEKYLSNEIDSLLLAEKIKITNDMTLKDTLKEKLLTLLHNSFDMKNILQKQMVTNLEKRILSLKENISKRENMKSKIINKRFNEITSNDYNIKW